jgi:hypothetical protein
MLQDCSIPSVRQTQKTIRRGDQQEAQTPNPRVVHGTEDSDVPGRDVLHTPTTLFVQLTNAMYVTHRPTAHQGHGTNGLQSRTNLFGRLFVVHPHLAVQVVCHPYTQSWEHLPDAPLQLRHENVLLLYQRCTTRWPAHQLPPQCQAQQTMHFARHEKDAPRTRDAVPTARQAECFDYLVRSRRE